MGVGTIIIMTSNDDSIVWIVSIDEAKNDYHASQGQEFSIFGLTIYHFPAGLFDPARHHHKLLMQTKRYSIETHNTQLSPT